MFRKVIGCLLFVAVTFGFSASAQQYAFQVTFTDKNNTPYSFSDPLVFLSPRSLQRRANQGIALDSTDFPVNPAYVDSVLTLTGGRFHETSRWLNMCMILLEAPDSAQILNLAGTSFIHDVKLVGYYSTDLHRNSGTTPSATGSASTHKTTTTDNTYYNNTWTQTSLVNGNVLHDNGFNGENMLIAVMDAGFIGADVHPGFDSMWQSGRMVDTFNFVYHNTGVFSADNHGEEVLSTMAGDVPGTYVGTAPRAMYALYVTEYDPNDQPLELDNMIAAAERADSIGADVISESLGYDLFLNPADGQTFAELDGNTTVAAKAANMATKKGILFVATAGNDGTGIPGWGNHILTPGDADSALTIGAVDYSGTLPNFSGFGPNAAGRVKPDVCGMGVASWVFGTSSGYSQQDGTSFSTPQIAGWAACIWQSDRSATPYKVKQAIIKCASSALYTTPGPQIGYGIPDFSCARAAFEAVPQIPFTTANWLQATPNPFNAELNISAAPSAAGNIHFTLTDMTGRVVLNADQYFNKGYNAPVDLSIPQLPAGIYILKAVSATAQQIIKLEKE